MMAKLSKKRIKQIENANKTWRSKNKKHARYLMNRTKARTFVRKYAKPADIRYLQKIWKKRKEDKK